MPATKPGIVTAFRILFIVVLLFNAPIRPFPASAAQSSETAVTEPTLTETSTSEPEITPTGTSTPSSTETPVPSGDTNTPESTIVVTETPSPASSTPSSTPSATDIALAASGGPSLVLSSDPGFITPAGVITLFWSIEGIAVEGLALQFVLPEGFSPLGDHGGLFDETTRILVLTPSVLNSELQIRTGSPENDVEIEASLFQSGELLTQASILLTSREQFIMDKQGGEFIAMDGKIKIKFPKDALKEKAVIQVGRPVGDAAPSYSLSNNPFDISIRSMQDNIDLHQLDDVVEIEVSYTELGIPDEEAGNLYLHWYNPNTQEWEALPSSVNTSTQTVTGITDHFSVFDVGVNQWQAANTPTIDNFQVAGFTGAGSFSLPIQVPPGPGGIQPNLTLSYNSQVVDQATTETQASWVGMGWSLDTGSIVMDTADSSISYDDTFFLMMDGVSTRLVRESNGTYHAASENFWKFNYNNTTNKWTIWDKVGNVYYFELVSTLYYRGDCDGPGTGGERPVHYQWSLTRVVNIYGQVITYTYVKETKSIEIELYSDYMQRCKEGTYSTDTATYPESIVYSNNHYRVFFEREARFDYKAGWYSDLTHHSFQRSRLRNIHIQYSPSGTGFVNPTVDSSQTVRRYQFTYETDPTKTIFPGHTYSAGTSTTGKVSTLIKVQEFGVGGSSGLPAHTFTYGDHIHLTRAENGYGGAVEFDYDDNPSQILYQPWSYTQGTIKDYRIEQDFGEEGVHCPTEGWSARDASSTVNVNCPVSDPYLRVRGNAIHSGLLSGAYLPLIRPGGVYKYTTYASMSSGMSVQVGVYDGVRNTLSSSYTSSGPISYYITLPKDASNMRMLISTAGGGTGTYALFSSFKVELLPSFYRVKQKRISDGNGHTYSYSYSYTDAGGIDTAAMNDSAHSSVCSPTQTNCTSFIEAYSEFRGNSLVTVTGPDGVQTVTNYQQDDIKKGQTATLTIKDPSGKKMIETIYTMGYAPLSMYIDPHYTYMGYGHYWVYPSKMESRTYHDNGTTYQSTQVLYDYEDGYGNMTAQTEQNWNGSAWSTYRITAISYYPNADPYLVGLPARQQIKNSSGTVIAESLNIYSQVPTAGILTAVRTWVDGALNTGRYSQVSYEYDQWGNRTAVTTYTGYGTASVAPSSTGAKKTTTSYDSANHTYPISQTTPPTTNAPSGLTTTWNYDYDNNNVDDYILGVVTKETDPNGNITSAQYDSFGRLIKLIRPGDDSANPTISISYTNAFPFTTTISQKIDTAPRYYTVQRVYDGMGRQTRITSGGTIVDTVYQSATVTKQSVPYQGTSPNQFTVTTVNPATRTTTVTAPDNTYSIITTNGLASTAAQYNSDGTLFNNHTTTTTTDVWGRVVSVVPFTGPSVTYTYDKLDRLETATRGGAVTAIKYDNAGRKIGMDDPDMGMAGTPIDDNWAWTYQYDALGNLTSQTDARGCVLNLGYDALNRLTSKNSTGSGCGTQVNAGYTYDAGANGKGQRTGMSDGSGSTAWTYDARGRMLSESRTITGAGTFNTSWTYNSADLPITMTYPDGEVVTNNYDNRMLLNSVLGAGTYVSSTTYDIAGRIDLRTFGNNTQTDYVYYPWTSQGGRLLNIKSGTTATPTSLQSLEYAYDAAGNVDWIKDWKAGSPQVQDFGYDALDRLDSAVVTGGSNGQYNETYTYSDTTGNLINKGGLALQYNNASHVHAVTNAGSNTYGYDASGNMTSRVVSGQTFGLTYNAENRLVSVSGSGAIPTSTPVPTNTSTPTPTATNTPIPTPASSATRVAYWKFEETTSPWSDSTGRGHSLTQVAGSVTSITAKVGKGLNNASNTTDLQTASHTDFDFTRSEGFSIETWARTSNNDDNWKMLFSRRGAAGSTVIKAGHWQGEMGFGVRTTSGVGYGSEIWYGPFMGGIAVNDGQWHHWVFFFSSTHIGMWLDGQLVMNVPHTIASGDFSASTPFYLLRDTNEVNRWLGDVDEFAVYKGVLSQAEIVDHYNNGAGKYYASVTEAPAVAKAPVSDYKTVSYSPPTTTLLEPALSPQMQTSTIASFTYDGDGRQVKAVVGSTTTYYVGAHYQVDNGVVTKYYFAGAQRVAMRKNGTLSYLLADHLGSTSLTTNTSGALVSELRYKAWGETRYSSGATPTSYRYTGQREEPGIGLYFYNARWYDPLIGRFTSADTIVPPGVQGLDRYAYVNNSPLRYTDPSGHKCVGDEAELCSPPNLHVAANPDGPDIIDPDLRKSDDRINALYSMYKEMWGNKDGWWWDRYGSGGFTIWEYMAIMWGYEQASYPNTNNFVSALSNKAGAWCHVRNCNPSTAEGAMVFMSRYSQSARSRAYAYTHGKSIDDLFYIPPSSWTDGGMQIVQGIQQSVFTGYPTSSALFDVGNISLRSDIFKKMLRLGLIEVVWGLGKEDRLVILTYCQSLIVNYAIANGGASAINQGTNNNFCGG